MPSEYLDKVYPFHSNSLGFLGRVVRLRSVWKHALAVKDLPKGIESILRDMVAASCLLAFNMKFDGFFTVQLQGGKYIKTLVCEVTSEGNFRSAVDLRKLDSDGSNMEDSRTFSEWTEGCLLVFTVDGTSRYQGITSVVGNSLQETLMEYFASSDQLLSYIQLASNSDFSSGILVQKLPGSEDTINNWEEVEILSKTLSNDELLDEKLPPYDIPHMLFHMHDVEVNEARPIKYACRCSRQKFIDVISTMERADIEEYSDENGEIYIDCEYCGSRYNYSINEIFS